MRTNVHQVSKHAAKTLHAHCVSKVPIVQQHLGIVVKVMARKVVVGVAVKVVAKTVMKVVATALVKVAVKVVRTTVVRKAVVGAFVEQKAFAQEVPELEVALERRVRIPVKTTREEHMHKRACMSLLERYTVQVAACAPPHLHPATSARVSSKHASCVECTAAPSNQSHIACSTHSPSRSSSARKTIL